MIDETLRKRPKYDELINYIESKQPKLKYPNRDATFLRNSPYLSQFDGDNSFINLEEQENNMMKAKLIQEAIRKISMINAGTQSHTGTQTTEQFDMSYDDDIDESYDEMFNAGAQQTTKEDDKKEKHKDLFKDATHMDEEEERAAEKREASQEVRPGRDTKIYKSAHRWHNAYRSRSPLRADPPQPGDRRVRINKKTPDPQQASAASRPPTGTKPPAPPPDTAPPTSTKGRGESSSSYPNLNKANAKEKVGTINIKRRESAPPAHTSSSKGGDEDEDPKLYNIPPSKMGIQLLREILENAYNKKKLGQNDDGKFQRAQNKYRMGIKNQQPSEKTEALNEMREIYKRLFYKKETL